MRSVAAECRFLSTATNSVVQALVVTMQVNKANFFSIANLDAMEAALDRLDSEPELQVRTRN